MSPTPSTPSTHRTGPAGSQSQRPTPAPIWSHAPAWAAGTLGVPAGTCRSRRMAMASTLSATWEAGAQASQISRQVLTALAAAVVQVEDLPRRTVNLICCSSGSTTRYVLARSPATAGRASICGCEKSLPKRRPPDTSGRTRSAGRGSGSRATADQREGEIWISGGGAWPNDGLVVKNLTLGTRAGGPLGVESCHSFPRHDWLRCANKQPHWTFLIGAWCVACPDSCSEC